MLTSIVSRRVQFLLLWRLCVNFVFFKPILQVLGHGSKKIALNHLEIMQKCLLMIFCNFDILGHWAKKKSKLLRMS